jgi:hypothetical protein
MWDCFSKDSNIVATPLQNIQENGMLSPRLRIFLMAVRQATIIFLGALEDLLDLERSITPRHKRHRPTESSRAAPE